MPSFSRKFSGSSSAAIAYYSREEDLDLGIEKTLSYHGADEAGENVFHTVWGELGKELGITDGITKAQFQDLWHGRWEGVQLVSPGWRKLHDDTGEVIGEHVRTSGFDVTFSTPKSVAELLVKASPELRTQIVEAWTESVREAVEVGIEAHGRLARVPVMTPAEVGPRRNKMQGSATERTTAKIIAIPVVQHTARPTAESVERGVSDPHMHAHVFVFSLCKTEDGKWRTADEYGLKGHGNPELRDQIAMAAFTRRLEDLGIELEYSEFERARHGRVTWSVKGSDKDLCRYWSTNESRAWKIRQDYEAEYGFPISDQILTEILSQTRRHKSKSDKSQDERPVFELWERNAKDAGFKLAPYQVAPRAASISGETGWDELKRFEELGRRLMGANGLCRDDAVFIAESVFPTVMRCGVGLGLSVDQLRTHAEALPHSLIRVRRAADPRHSYFTTPRILGAETAIEKALAQKEVKTLPAPSRPAVRHGINSLDFALDPEQIAAVRAVCGPSGLVNIVGIAGSGKTAAMRAAVNAYRVDNACDQVVVISTAAATAKRSAMKLGADRYGSVESILVQKERAGLKFTNRSLVIVDEAGMLDTLRAEALLEAVGDARVVLLGDLKQLPGIGASGWWSSALEVHPSVELTMARRQKDPADVRDSDLIRQGRAKEALRNQAERGRVHIAEDSGERIRQVMRDYVKFREGWRADNVRIVAERNVDVDTVNRFVQKYRLDHVEIRPGGFDVEDAESNRRWTLHENDQVVFRRSYVIRGEEPVRNGSAGTILSIDERSGRTRIRLDDSHRVVTVRLQDHELTQPVAPAYCQVIDRYQGHEAEIIQNIAGLSSQNHGYTEVTRGIYETHTYVSKDIFGAEPIEKLGEVWSQEIVKETALSRLRQIESEAEVGVAELDPVPDLEPEPELEPEPVLDDQRLEQAKEDLGRDDDWLKTFEAEMSEREQHQGRDTSDDFGQGM